MGFKHATLRQRLFHAADHEKDQAKHGTFHEFMHEILFIVSNLMFLIGSCCFFEGVNPFVYKAGVWLFMIGALIQFLLCVSNLKEQIAAKKHLTGKFSDRDRQEVVETFFFVVACFVFFVGSVLFLPNLAQAPETIETLHAIGAWNFIIGSTGLVTATYYNALGLASERATHPEMHGNEELVYNLKCSGLGLTQLGAVCFVVGSVLYRPAFENKCAGVDAETSWNDSMNNGTIIYVVGSLFFLAESVLGLAAAVLKHDDEQSSSEDERDFMRHASEKAKQKAKRATVAMSSGRSLQTRFAHGSAEV